MMENGLEEAMQVFDKVIEKDKVGIGYYINGTEKVKFDLNFFYVNEYIICFASKI